MPALLRARTTVVDAPSHGKTCDGVRTYGSPRAFGAVGSALPSHGRGHRFESGIAHPYAGPVAARRNPFREFFTGVGMLGRGFKVWVTAPKLMLLGAHPRADRRRRVHRARGDAHRQPRGSVRGGHAVRRGLGSHPGDPGAHRRDDRADRRVPRAVGLHLHRRDPHRRRLVLREDLGPRRAPARQSRRCSPMSGSGAGSGGPSPTCCGCSIPTVLFGVLVLAVGFVPLVGSVLAFMFGAFISGWFLAVETTGLAFDGRGFRLRERRRMLRSRRAMTLGIRRRVLPGVPDPGRRRPGDAGGGRRARPDALRASRHLDEAPAAVRTLRV